MSEADRQKMQQLESLIGEYRNQMSKLERLLKEDEELQNDADKREEAEKMRN